MMLLRHLLASCALVGALVAANPALAASEAAKPASAKGADKALVLKDDARCTTCHDEADNPELLQIGKRRHGALGDKRTPTCVNCHGDSDKHVNHKGSDKPPVPDRSFGKKTATPADQRSSTCLTCHKGGNRMQWAGSQHEASDVACSSCHSVHTKRDAARDKQTQSDVCFSCHKEQRSETLRTSTHPLHAGGVSCSSCHNPHGSSGPKLLVKNTVNETCWSCHAEKRGPFLWEHPSASDDCMNCHVPHGSNQSPLLKTRQPFLCAQCHIAGGHSGTGIRSGNDLGAAVVPGGAAAAAAQMVGKSCANCHTEVHGSNHPSGARFVR